MFTNLAPIHFPFAFKARSCLWVQSFVGTLVALTSFRDQRPPRNIAKIRYDYSSSPVPNVYFENGPRVTNVSLELCTHKHERTLHAKGKPIGTRLVSTLKRDQRKNFVAQASPRRQPTRFVDRPECSGFRDPRVPAGQQRYPTARSSCTAQPTSSRCKPAKILRSHESRRKEAHIAML